MDEAEIYESYQYLSSDKAFAKAVDAAGSDKRKLNELLKYGVEAHSVVRVGVALDAGADIEATYFDGTALAKAGRLGGLPSDLKVFDYLLLRGANPNGPGVMLNCRADLVQSLVALGADINGTRRGQNVLLYAITNRSNPDKALALIEGGAELEVADRQGRTPLIAAAVHGRKKVFDALRDAGADSMVVDKSGRSVLRCAVEAYSGVGTAQVSNGATMRAVIRKLRDELPAQPEDVLLATLAMSDAKDLKRRLKDGLDANTLIPGGMAGHIGVSGGTVLDLLKKTDDLRQDFDQWAGGCSLLMWAVMLDDVELVKVLLEAGADPLLENKAELTPIQLAGHFKNERIMDMLSGLFENEERFEEAKTRADRLNTTAENAERFFQRELKWVNVPIEKFVDRNMRSSVTDFWWFASACYVTEDLPRLQQHLPRFIERGCMAVFDPSQPEPDLYDRDWMRAYIGTLALCVASGDWEKARELGAWVNPKWVRPDYSDGQGQESYSYVWPLLQIWSAEVAGHPLANADEYVAMIENQKSKRAKILLKIWQAIEENNPKRFKTSVKTFVTNQRKMVSKYGTIYPDRVCWPDVTFLVCWAIKQGMAIDLPEEVSDWVLMPFDRW